MRKYKVKKNGDTMQIRYRVDKKEQFNQLEMNVVSKEKITTLCLPQTESGGKRLRFELSCSGSLDDYFQDKPPFGSFCAVVRELAEVVQRCEARGIKSTNLELRAQYIFYGKDVHSLQVLFLPLTTISDYMDKGNVFRAFGVSYQCQKKDEPYKAAYLSFFEGHRKLDVFRFEKNLIFLENSWKAGRDAPISETKSLLSKTAPYPNATGTYMRDEDAAIVAVLRHADADCCIEINQYPFTVGRLPKYCNYAVQGDPQMSRTHFMLRKMQGKVFAFDYHSLNGTQVNGMPVPSGGYALSDGDVIAAGNQEFVFEIDKGSEEK